MEAVLLSVVLLSGGYAAKSPLVVIFLVLVAASVLRFQAELVAYVTGICFLSYLLLVGWTFVGREIPDASLTETVPMAISILCVGLIQYFALRRSQSVFELVARRRN